jgi:dienelactone hydrolase
MTTADIEYQDGALTCRGVVAYDETIAGKRPGILVVHEAFGLGEHAISRAESLAKLGYVALAADMFGNRLIPDGFEHAIQLITALLSDPQVLLARAGAALDTLAKLPQTDAGKLGAIGFCFGGSTVLALARQGKDLAGVVSFHGGLSALPPAIEGGVKAKVLVCTGGDDPMIPASDVVAFEDSMRAAHADWQVISYGNTLHSFTNPGADGSVHPAVLYNATTDKRSWAAMRGFFEEAFAG